MTFAQTSNLVAPLQHRLEWQESGAGRASSVSFTTLHQGPRASDVAPGRMLVSYVLRHSASGMDVRSSDGGQRCRLGAGAMLVCSGPGLVLQRGAVQRGARCVAIDLLLPGASRPGVFIHMDDYYPTFINSARGCLRLLMGSWDGHRALLAPIDGFWMLDVDVAPGEELHVPVSPPGAVAVLTTGSLVVDGTTVDGTRLLLLDSDGQAIRLASDAGASLLLFPQGFL